MSTVLSMKNVVARKEYNSDYFYCFEHVIGRDENGDPVMEPDNDPYTEEEIKLIQSCIDDEWMIKKGELHYCQTGVKDGEMYTARGRIGIHEICEKYDLFIE